MKHCVSLGLLLFLPSAAYGCLGRSLITSGGGSGGAKKPAFDLHDGKPVCERFDYVPRKQWGALEPSSKSDITSSVDKLFIYHTIRQKCGSIKWCSTELQGIQKYHMTVRGYQDIGYSFLVGNDYRIYEGRGWDVVGEHTHYYDNKAYGIAFMGNYMRERPDTAALKAVKNLIKCGIEKGKISSSYLLYGQRDVKSTECHDDKLYKEISGWANFGGISSPLSAMSQHTCDPNSACVFRDGRCQEVSVSCNGEYQPRLCGGDANIRCCLPSPGGSSTSGPTDDPDSACTSQDGNCQEDSQPCDGEYKSGLCGGDAYNRCCLPRQGGVPDPTTSEAPEISDGGSSTSGPTDDRQLILTTEERNRLEEQLKIDEDVKYVIYYDSEDLLTFGIGHLITSSDPEYGLPNGTAVSEERVMEAFVADLKEVLKNVYAWSNDCNTWPSEVKEIIANMMFNMGLPRMNGFVKLKAAVQARNWTEAANQMEDSKWAGQVKGRATRLINRMRKLGGTSEPSATETPAGSDPKCNALQGTCQTDTEPCNGYYQSLLCAGAASKRCCVPKLVPGSCPATVKQHACDLLSWHDSGKIRLWDQHPSGVQDNAFPLNNIRDTCDGYPASLSAYSCKECSSGAPGGRVCLSETLMGYLHTLGSKGEIIVNEIAGACHSCSSKHYYGRAVDLNNKGNRSSEFLELCESMGGWADNEGTHIHCQFKS